MKSLRVLVVAESFLPQVNGVTNSVCRVLDHLADTGHAAEVVAPTGPDLHGGFRVSRVRGARLPLYPDFRLGWESRGRLRTVLHRFQPDVVHLASPATLGYQAARVAHEYGVPTVSIYQTDLAGFAEQYRVAGGVAAAGQVIRRIHRRTDRTLAPSTASVDQLVGLGVEDVHLWPRGVDGVLFHPERRKESVRQRLAPGGEVLLGYVGRLAPEKELGLLVHLQDLPGTRLVVVGGGPEAARLRHLLPRAHFTGVLGGEELAETYAALDVFVHTGRHETFCQAAQEALASGVPVIAPASGGPLDLVDPGHTGFLYTPGSGEELRAAVIGLVADRRLRRALGGRARASVEARTWRAVNERLVDHYREMVTGRRSTPRAG